MLNDNEKTLLNAGLKGFPLLLAAAAAWKRCGQCGHADVNIGMMLRAVATAYLNNAEFRNLCKSLFKLPAIIGGILIKEN